MKPPKNLRDFTSVSQRREYVSTVTKTSLKNIGTYSLDENRASTRNCENMIGVTQIPLGIAGPLLLKTNNSQPTTYNCYLPLATTEGALVASVNRGCKTISESGGTRVFVEKVGTTRGPVFKTTSLSESFKFKHWLETQTPKIAAISQASSKHLKFLRQDIEIVGNNVYVRFAFDTQEAMGMNMATIATTQIAAFIEASTKVECIAVAGNYDVDKKPSWLNFIKKRGFAVWAEVTIPKEIVINTLKTTPEKICEVAYRKQLLGSALSGSLGFNAHFANIVVAIFLATGQDPGHIVEGSMGITTTEIIADSKLNVSIYMPSLMVGTVGGGTALGTQKEALTLMGITEKGNGKSSEKFAQIVAGAVLAGELSLTASIAEGSLTKAHQKLARGK